MTARGPVRVVVDPVACDGVGMCAHVAAGVIGLDRWGFPVLPGRPVDGRDLRVVRAAQRACPRRALHLDEDEG